ncbi:MAG TPA: cytochrome c [Methylocystis sp.]|nr:cytochrome c [Methylocystis sp.]
MRIAWIVLASLVISAPAGANDSIARGAAIARANCSRCHAIGARGASPNPKSPPFWMLGRKYPLADLQEALAEGILVGHEGDEMPRFQFSPSQIEALLAYLKSVQRK